MSGVQDLLAIDFSLLAMHFALSKRLAALTAAFGCAVLSKETAVMIAPALLAIPWIESRSIRRVVPLALGLGALLVIWALIHPGLHALASHGKVSPPGTFFGQTLDPWGSLASSAIVLMNLPLKFPTPWPHPLTWAVAIASIPFALGLSLLRRSEDSEPAPSFPRIYVVVIGLLLAVPPALLTCFFVPYWSPYYACPSALGVAIVLGCILAKAPSRIAFGYLSIYFLLGIWARGVELKPGITSEQSLVPAGKALRVVERNFKRLEPTLPPSSVVYVTTMATGAKGIYRHLHYYQAIRVWYADPSIQTLRPELHVLSSGPEFLFWVDPKLNVHEVDRRNLSVRSGTGPADHEQLRSTLISYAIGLAGIGEIERAVTVLLAIDPPGSGSYVVDRRIAAMLLLSRREDSAAFGLLSGVPALEPNAAFRNVAMMLTVPTRGTPLEEAAIRAFGLSPADPSLIRALLQQLLLWGYNDVAERLTHRLLALEPNDPEALKALRRIKAATVRQGLVAQPAPRLEFPE